MEFRLSVKSSTEDILEALTCPGPGNIIFCDDEVFNYITSLDKSLDSIQIDRPNCIIESQ